MRKRTLSLVASLVVSLFSWAQGPRDVVSLNGDWFFTDPDKGVMETVKVPHSWDNFKSAYNLFANVKTCSYQKTLDVSAYAGKRLLLEFQGVNKTAVVKIDDVQVAKHIGGFSTFYVDITEAAAGKEQVTLTVDATNMDFNTMPVNSDFTHFAGIYRDVNLIATNKEVSISNADHGSKGVYAPYTLSSKTATITPKVMLDYATTESKVVTVKAILKDATGKQVGAASTEKTIEASASAEELVLPNIVLSNTHLWNGTADPYLYTLSVELYDEHSVLVDAVSEKVGFRTFAVKSGKFYLNGSHYTLRGVGMHQERGAATNATTAEERLEDINTVLEMGANALRTCHYPHNQQLYDLCDEKGIVVWSEVPFYLVMLETQNFKDNCMQSVKEMVKQGYNHPSIIVWGIQNEVNVYPAYQAYYPTQATVEQLGTFIKELAQTVKALDPKRFVGEAEIDNTSYAQETAGWTTKDSGISTVGFNIYTGWYGTVDGATQANKFDRIGSSIKNKLYKYRTYFNTSSENSVNFVMTEYGAGANVNQHAELDENFIWGGSKGETGYLTTGNFHPEEYQSYVHEGMLMALYGDNTNSITAAPNIWCAFAWAMYDFSCYRNEGGTTRLNTKGLITADRQTKKDAFYLYKANWNKTDRFTHICSKRFANRSKRSPEVKVYSNCDKVELIVNGTNVGAGEKLQDGVFVWHNASLKNGQNTVVANGTCEGSTQVYSDECNTWTLANPERETFSLNGEWQFTDPDKGVMETVQVPHSWDNFKSAYNLFANVKTCSYQKTLDVSAYAGKRLLLQFDGVNKTAVVKVDSIQVAKHVGGFSTFYVDITEAAQGKDEVKVTVDVTNMDFNTMPVNSDFTHFAGIYRDVNLVVLNPNVSISNLDNGSKGVYLNYKVSGTDVALAPTVVFDSKAEGNVKVVTTIKNAAGTVVATDEQEVALDGTMAQAIQLPDSISLTGVKLWNGTKNPYLYTVTTQVVSEGQVVDQLTQKVGFRTIAVKNGRFYLNGSHYTLRGVGMHQEYAAATNVTTPEQREADINNVLEMGANALRTCHYPHNQQLYDLCDEKGIVVWSEVPFYLVMLETQNFKDNCMQSVKEMVKQGYNHPSIVVWGIQNEVNVYPAYQAYYPTQATVEQLGTFIKELAQTVKTLDPTRFVGEAEIDNTSYAQETAGWTTKDSGINTVGFNIYTGWYSNVNGATQANKLDRIDASIKDKLTKYKKYFSTSSESSVNYVMTEYGAGANVNQHADLDENFIWGGSKGETGYLTTGNFHPEEYQSYVHEGMLMALYGDNTNSITAASGIWCAFAWAMYDFSCYRNEGGTTRLNTKGLITADRQTKKDAFYLYKANWNQSESFAHICSSRYTERPNNVITVKVYSNCERVDLTVNGTSLGAGTKIQDGVFEWYNVELQNGTNEVLAEGSNEGTVVCSDACNTWTSTATGITEASSSDKPQTPIYNLAGQRVQKPGKGLYIIDGKKMIGTGK